MPEIANESIVNKEADPEVLNKDAALRPSTSTGSVTPVISIPKPGNMIITVSKRKFECVPIESASGATEKSKKEKLNEIFQIPQAEQKAKMGPACMQGLPKLPCCVSDDCYIKMLKDKEDKKKKKKEEEEKEKRKKGCEEKAEKKQTEEKQKAALKEAKKSILKGQRVRKPAKKVKPETSSSDDSEPEYDDSSDTPSDDSEEFYEGMTSRCSKCQE